MPATYIPICLSAILPGSLVWRWAYLRMSETSNSMPGFAVSRLNRPSTFFGLFLDMLRPEGGSHLPYCVMTWPNQAFDHAKKTRSYTRQYQSLTGGQGQSRKLNSLSASFLCDRRSNRRSNRRTNWGTNRLIDWPTDRANDRENSRVNHTMILWFIEFCVRD